jgi:vacuolar-type H+-ATPase subunit I/STV1
VSAISLRRADTERPKSTSALGRAEAQYQMSSLTEALTSAKKEIENQSARLRDLEALLHQERRARESAEDRVSQLEREALKEKEATEATEITIIEPENAPQLGADDAVVPDIVQVLPTMDDSATARLQQRLDLMMNEMSEMKQQMERYRLRAENAEAESATHRQSLAEMVEKIRADEASRAARDARRRSRSNDRILQDDDEETDESEEEGSEEGEITIIREGDMDGEGAGVLLRRGVVQNGRAVLPDPSSAPKLSQQTLSTRPNPTDPTMLHGGPAVSIVGIVLIGMGLMAWLNNYSKVER